jgi:hypothetical protein
VTTTGLLAWLFPVDLIGIFCWLLAWLLQLFQVPPPRVRLAVVIVGLVLLIAYFTGAFGPVHFGRTP